MTGEMAGVLCSTWRLYVNFKTNYRGVNKNALYLDIYKVEIYMQVLSNMTDYTK